MIHQKSFLAELNVPKIAQEIAAGEIRLPIPAVEQPAKWRGGPPGLIPLWSNSDAGITQSYWHNWFSVQRPSSFVKCYATLGYRLTENARTWRQLTMEILLEQITKEEGVSDRLKLFAAKVDLSDLDAIDRISSSTGDDLLGLLELREFSENAPLLFLEKKGRIDSSNADLGEMCSLEVSERDIVRIKESRHCPVWFFEQDQERSFFEQIENGNLRAAWLTLNSRGWKYRNARDALSKLAERAQTAAFQNFATVWISLNHELFGSGY